MVIKPNSSTAGSQINVSDRDIIILILEFLESKNLNISQVTLERETGIVNGSYSEEVAFLRNLVLEGQWDDAVDYVEPLTEAVQFDYNFFKKIIHKYKYLELLCVKNEIDSAKFSDQAALACLKDLEAVCDKAEFNEFRLLLSYPRIQDHPDYRDWNPSSARVMCFREIRPIVETVLHVDGHTPTAELSHAPASRLIHLLIKGLLYETAWRLCPQRAKKGSDDLRFSALIPKSSPEPDMALLCWLQVIPADVFTCQFEEKNLPLNYRKLEKPALEATWSELIQQSPIRAITNKQDEFVSPRPVANDRMVQSMVEQMDGFRRKSFGSSSARQRLFSQSFHLGGLGQEDPFVSGIFSGSSPRPNPSRSARADVILPSGGNASVCEGAKSGAGDMLALKESPGELLSPISEQVGFDEDENEPVEPPPVPSPRTKKKGKNDNQDTNARTRMDDERKKLHDDWEERERQRELLMAQILQPAVGKIMPVTTPVTSTLPSNTRKPPIVSPLVYSGDQSRTDSSSASIISSPPASSSSPVKNSSQEQDSQPLTSPLSKDITKGSAFSYSVSNPSFAQVSSRNGSSPDGSYSVLSQASGDVSRAASHITSRNSVTIGQQFVPVQTVRDAAAIRCAAFHPSGNFYAVGSNSKVLRICTYPPLDQLRSFRPEHAAMNASVVDQRLEYHRSSVFCLAWNPSGNLLATGSNDKTVKLAGFDSQRQSLTDKNIELRIHNDTIRDVVFMNQTNSTNSYMITGAADGKIVMTDCVPATAIREYNDHTGSVLSLNTWSGNMFVSGSLDKTCRLWDVRKAGPLKVIDAKKGCPESPVTCVRVDVTGKLLVTAHENGELMMFDLQGDRVLQIIKAHEKEMRGLSISPKSNVLLTCSYDRTVVAHNMEGNLFEPLPVVTAAVHTDKVIQCHWHPLDNSFITTSADKTCVLWAYPQFQPAV